MADEPEVNVSAQTESAGVPSESPEQTAGSESVQPEDTGSDQSSSEGQTEEVSEVKSERGQKRVQQLANQANRAGELEQEVQTLRQQLSANQENTQTQDSPQVTEQLPPWMNQEPSLPQLGDEVTPEQYQQHVLIAADQLVQQRLAQRDRQAQIARSIQSNYDKDISQLEKKYADAFDSNDPVLSRATQRAFQNYQRAIRVDPNARVADYLEPILEARSGGVDQGRETASANLARQAAEGAVQPGSSSAKNVSSQEQLEQMLAKGEITAEEAMKNYPDLLSG